MLLPSSVLNVVEISTPNILTIECSTSSILLREGGNLGKYKKYGFHIYLVLFTGRGGGIKCFFYMLKMVYFKR